LFSGTAFADSPAVFATNLTGHTATLLSENGQVLFTGGFDGTNVIADANVYEPNSGSVFPSGGSLANVRQQHTATLLPDGRVLIAGGSGASAPFSSAEIYLPALDSFVPTASLITARTLHAAVLLGKGDVWITGGTTTKTAEMFTP
jgi:hypothetical protein